MAFGGWTPLLRIKKAVGIFRELITTTRTTGVAFGDPPSGSKIKTHRGKILDYCIDRGPLRGSSFPETFCVGEV